MSDPTGLETENHPRTRKELRVVFGGLMLALTLAALDQNIVATALPRIVSDLGGLAHLSWVVTAFLVASTTTTPLYGKFSDLYGRKPAFMVSIIIFLLGSTLCGVAQGMTQLPLPAPLNPSDDLRIRQSHLLPEHQKAAPNDTSLGGPRQNCYTRLTARLQSVSYGRCD